MKLGLKSRDINVVYCMNSSNKAIKRGCETTSITKLVMPLQ